MAQLIYWIKCAINRLLKWSLNDCNSSVIFRNKHKMCHFMKRKLEKKIILIFSACVLFHLFKSPEIIDYFILHELLCLCISFKIVCTIQNNYLCKQQMESDKRLLFDLRNREDNINSVKYVIYILAYSAYLCYFRYGNIGNELLHAMIIFISVGILTYCSFRDKNEILEVNELNIGFGAAIWYYKNYLEFFVPYPLIERIEQFISYNKVNVEKRLFILVPESCKVRRYLEENETIERCQELPKQELTQGGVKDRVYNITVYLIKSQMYSKKVRMAVEYAQPLKGLYSLKEKKIITEDEMYHQRKLFVQTLQKYLKDNNESYKFCKLIEYNEDRNISEVLLENYNYNLPYESV